MASQTTLIMLQCSGQGVQVSEEVKVGRAQCTQHTLCSHPAAARSAAGDRSSSMLPIMRRAAAEDGERRCAAASDVLPLDLIFQHLPPVEVAVTVSRLSKEWWQWSKPRFAAAMQDSFVSPRRLPGWLLWHCRLPAIATAPPLWAVRESWPRLNKHQRGATAADAAYHHDADTLQWLCDHTSAFEECAWHLCQAAALGGRLDVLKQLHAKGCISQLTDPTSLCYPAGESGNLELLRWLRTEEGLWDAYGCACGAARGGRLEALQWLSSLDADADAAQERVIAYRERHPEGCALGALDGTLPWDQEIFNAAAESGNVATLQWLRANGCPWFGEAACWSAALRGRLEALQWLHVNGCSLDSEACTQAAYGGHLEVLQWLYDKGCHLGYDACSSAAHGGHLAVLQWLRAHGAPWDGEACSVAAENGRLEVVQFLHANGCPWTAEACTRAASLGHLDVVDWMYDNGCPLNVDAIANASEDGRQWLKDRGLLL